MSRICIYTLMGVCPQHNVLYVSHLIQVKGVGPRKAFRDFI